MHPALDDRGTWLGEGLATYYQTVLRVRAGRITAAAGWQRMAEGYAEAHDDVRGEALEDVSASMNRTHHFSYVYRAGALFWLTMDVDLRRASNGKQSLDSALAAFRACCLPSYREWEPEEFIQHLDRALGVQTFTRRYDEFRARTTFPEWRDLFARLGVDADGKDVPFDDAAPDAAIRTAIMAPVSRDPQDRPVDSAAARPRMPDTHRATDPNARAPDRTPAPRS
jgi:predicted metalloprotease with PDZ domain